MKIKSSDSTDGPTDSGYYTAGIDVYKPDPPWRDEWHHHAMQFHSKDKAEAERMRDLVMARLEN